MTMEKIKKTLEILNDLIKVNNDRIEGYKKAYDQTITNDLQIVFKRMAEESESYNLELAEKVMSLGGDPASGTMLSGKIYRKWMSLEVTFSGGDQKSILEACERGEDAAQKAYGEALSSGFDLSTDIQELIAYQKHLLKISHDLIRHHRDQYQEIEG